jgi:multidrug efflux system membrane fusion protein
MMKAQFANQDRHLWPGQFVNVNLQLTTEKDATVVPSQAIQNGQQGTFVYVVKPDKSVELRVVELGPTDNGSVVIRKGVAPGETVVTDGQVRLTPGAKVEFKTESSKSAVDSNPVGM